MLWIVIQRKYFTGLVLIVAMPWKVNKSLNDLPLIGSVSADYNDVIYAAYRTALKLLHIRNNHHCELGWTYNVYNTCLCNWKNIDWVAIIILNLKNISLWKLYCNVCRLPGSENVGQCCLDCHPLLPAAFIPSLSKVYSLVTKNM